MPKSINFPDRKAHFLLPGIAGDIEVATTAVELTSTNKTIVVCHPHPLHGGTMQNKVVTTLVRTFHAIGFNSVRFNFRGVGASGGEHAAGIGEADDLITILDWLGDCLPQEQLYLAGFSFGAYVAYRVATASHYKDKLQHLLLVAPPVQYPEFQKLSKPKAPWTVVQGEADEVVEPRQVFAWLNDKQHQARLISLPATGHFFHGKLIELKNQLISVFQ